MTTKGKPDDEPKTLRDVVWQELDNLANSTESITMQVKKITDNKDAVSIHQDLIQKMITAIRGRSVDTLRELAEEDERFAYTPNIRQALDMMNSED